jgi:hypothetical protein
MIGDPTLLLPHNGDGFISLEELEYKRTYIFEAFEYEIEHPKLLKVRDSGAHMVVDSNNLCHYIKEDFNAIQIKGEFGYIPEDPAEAEDFWDK